MELLAGAARLYPDDGAAIDASARLWRLELDVSGITLAAH